MKQHRLRHIQDDSNADRRYARNRLRLEVWPALSAAFPQAEASLAELAASGRIDGPIATHVEAAGEFYPAEDYHQDYYLKNPIRYKYYRSGCGRDRRLEALWGRQPGTIEIAPPAHVERIPPRGTRAEMSRSWISLRLHAPYIGEVDATPHRERETA